MKPSLDHITPWIVLAAVGLLPLMITAVAVMVVVIMPFLVPTKGNREHSLAMMNRLTEFARVVGHRRRDGDASGRGAASSDTESRNVRAGRDLDAGRVGDRGGVLTPGSGPGRGGADAAS